MSCNYTTTTHAKWILAGEHAVLRGHGALVFPMTSHQITLKYLSAPHELDAEFTGSYGPEMHLLFWSVLQEGCQLIGQSFNQLHGHFDIQNTIPIGVGMGASAALCVATARWFSSQNLIKTDEINEFAKSLEDLFHGKSSGLDIAGVASDIGIYFQQGQTKTIHQTWQPHWYLSSCGQIGVTAHCIAQVKSYWDANPAKAYETDQLMNNAVNNAMKALEDNNNESLSLLSEAINNAHQCFVQWDLISENLSHHIQQLEDYGAIAVKPTGSGGGGFVLSLWPNAIETTGKKIPFEMISLSHGTILTR